MKSLSDFFGGGGIAWEVKGGAKGGGGNLKKAFRLYIYDVEEEGMTLRKIYG